MSEISTTCAATIPEIIKTLKEISKRVPKKYRETAHVRIETFPIFVFKREVCIYVCWKEN